MLTIQPNFTTAKPVKKIAFKSNEDDAATETYAVINGRSEAENRFYQMKVSHYEKQVEDFDKALQDKDTPTLLKRAIKVFKVASEALLEGWAVAWGAKKGAKVIKNPMVNSKFAKGTGKVFKTIGKGLGKVAAGFSEGYTKFKATKFMTENSFGKILSKGLGYIEKAFTFIGEKISKLTAPLKGEKAGAVYDKAADVTSKTFGVGAGAAGAYNAATEGKQTPKTEEGKQPPKEEENKTPGETDTEDKTDDEFVEDKKFPEDGE